MRQNKIFLLFFCIGELAAAPICREMCGEVWVPYPFGFGDPSCAKNESFLLICEEKTQTLHRGKLVVHNISVVSNTVTVGGFSPVYKCFNRGRAEKSHDRISISLKGGPLTISTVNKLTVVGCNAIGLLSDVDGRLGGGCLSLCSNNESSNLAGSYSGQHINFLLLFVFRWG